MFSATSGVCMSSCGMGTSHTAMSGIALPVWFPLLSAGISPGSKWHGVIFAKP